MARKRLKEKASIKAPPTEVTTIRRLCAGLLKLHSPSLLNDNDERKLLSFGRLLSRGLLDIKTLSTSYCLPPALQRKKKRKEFAQAAEVFNFEFSDLHKLPYELILDIIGYLATVDNIALKLTCRRHASISTNQTTKAERKDLTCRLRRDGFPALAAAELPSASLLSRMLCCKCHTSHPKSAFPPSETGKLAYTRRCLGAAGTFRLCGHRCTDFEYFRSHYLDSKRDQSRDFACHKCRVRAELKGIAMCPGIGRDSNGDMYSIRMILQKKCSSEGMLRAQVYSHVHKLSEPVCPHTMLNDRCFLYAIREGPVGGRRPGTTWFAGPRENIYKAWTCNDCDSTLFVARMIRGGQGFFVAGVYRNLGKMEDATDPVWVAHLEENRHRPASKRSHIMGFSGGRHVNPSADDAVRRALDRLLEQKI